MSSQVVPSADFAFHRVSSPRLVRISLPWSGTTRKSALTLVMSRRRASTRYVRSL